VNELMKRQLDYQRLPAPRGAKRLFRTLRFGNEGLQQPERD
jgi:hypothetical protein